MRLELREHARRQFPLLRCRNVLLHVRSATHSGYDRRYLRGRQTEAQRQLRQGLDLVIEQSSQRPSPPFGLGAAVTGKVLRSPVARGKHRVGSNLTGERAFIEGHAPDHTERLGACERQQRSFRRDRKSTRLNSSHEWISYAVFCLKKKK